ncbi:hypothetical protein M422DRAFT_170827 [Sphaerobolus stellatus SS14]|uniref:Unplaced genomic scaffold SPHSTscaffold_53, whole genome shotgun sequence n=1 Tax=Sphaerobolus stellatus (strain SS14) TaxID=990650 RepID=A0A0C9UHU7_SPHS4|nr:hypothetical protein M422DRAFT_170827 [Sphaerobolus stellatus SS14]
MKFTLLSSILLSASLIGAQNPLPPGTYQVINRVLDPAGNKLALTFNGNQALITVQPVSNNSNQLWVLTDFSNPTVTGNSLAPLNSGGFQVGPVGNFPTSLAALPFDEFVWPSTNVDGSFRVSDGEFDFFWGLNNATDGAEVQVSQLTGQATQLWVFLKVA